MNGFNGIMSETKIEIQTGLTGFIMLDSICEAGATEIMGIRTFSDEPAYLGLEALAQLGAFHIRRLTGFDRHVFLLKIAGCRLSAGKFLNGKFVLSGKLLSRSDSAFLCRMKAEKEEMPVIEGDFLFGLVDYDEKFKRELLRGHYERIFTCLLNDIKPG